MFEYHGWATLREDPYKLNSPQFEVTVEELRKILDQFNDGSGVFQINSINGAYHLSFTGHPNHRHNCVLGLFEWIAERLKRSYGLLYVWDDESKQENEFVVFRLLRGTVEVMKDPFLSPCIPVLEDPFDPNRPDE